MRRSLWLRTLAVHLCAILWVIFAPKTEKKIQKPLLVKTRKIAATPAPSAPSRPPPPKKEKPQPKPIPKKEKPAPAPVPNLAPEKPIKPKPEPLPYTPPKKTEKPAPPPPKIQPAPAVSNALLKQLQESIAKIDSTPTNKKTPTTTLQIDSPKGNYTDALIATMHASLQLPDFGEVSLQLTLRQDGSVAKIAILKAASEKNRRYLESALLTVRFPHFDGALSREKEHTFTLMFCNEI
ncbi:MAG: hypothetical protein JSS61_06135 [Verrucomicrobia bacterium]|nr:hypothetical protein [Verrucomicrobiota bacterium]